jgi:RNA recognition motif-containing protein
MNLYVGNLSFDTDEQALRRLFADYGNVTSARIITDRDTGRSRGFGFVELEDDSAALKAVNELNGAELDGRTLTINEARPREPRQQRSRW